MNIMNKIRSIIIILFAFLILFSNCSYRIFIVENKSILMPNNSPSLAIVPISLSIDSSDLPKDSVALKYLDSINQETNEQLRTELIHAIYSQTIFKKVYFGKYNDTNALNKYGSILEEKQDNEIGNSRIEFINDTTDFIIYLSNYNYNFLDWQLLQDRKGNSATFSADYKIWNNRLNKIIIKGHSIGHYHSFNLSDDYILYSKKDFIKTIFKGTVFERKN
jgi:hypothetical protein